MNDLKNKLNPSQQAAVTTIKGPVLVIAGAGSGKTRAIEYRVLHMVNSGINPESILLLTFTKKAASEMLSRTEKHDLRCKHVNGGTFHSFAFKILKKYASILGLSNNFSILDEGDSEDAIHKCAYGLELFEYDKKFPKKDTLQTIISMSTNKNLAIKDILEREYPHFAIYSPAIEKLKKHYAAYKIEKNYMDYDDLLIHLKSLLEIEEFRKKISEKYLYVMIDEFQDTNSIQGDIAYLLAKDHQNIMAVGDDAQSIYGFRGSSHKNIMEFPKKFTNCKVIKLEKNYRSTQSILNIANSALENMTNKYSKCLHSTRPEIGDKAKINYFKNAYEEAEWIVSKILELKKSGVPIGAQAILFRSAYISIALQAELSKCHIPYDVYGGLKFYETAHVKDVIAHLRVLKNPKDEIAWHRVLMLIEGIGPKTADKFNNSIMSFDSLEEIKLNAFKEAKITKSSRGLARLKKLIESVNKDHLNPGNLYELCLDYYLPILREKFDDWHIRVNDLDALKLIAQRYDSLDDFLGDFAIEPPNSSGWRKDPATPLESKPLVLSTIHSSKGLEWDTVYLIGLVDGILPISFALNSEEEIEEESRLFYVAITRAKNRLFMSLNQEGTRNGMTQYNKISRFIDSPEILRHIDQELVIDEDAVDDIFVDEYTD